MISVFVAKNKESLDVVIHLAYYFGFRGISERFLASLILKT